MPFRKLFSESPENLSRLNINKGISLLVSQHCQFEDMDGNRWDVLLVLEIMGQDVFLINLTSERWACRILVLGGGGVLDF